MSLLTKLLTTSLILANFALAADTAPAKPEASQPMHNAMPSKEHREKMAVAHEKMATCLRSESSMEECHQVMMKSCEENMGKGNCPMMGNKGMMGKRGMHGMHHPENADKKDVEKK